MWVQKSYLVAFKMYPTNKMKILSNIDRIISIHQGLLEKNKQLTTKIARLTAFGCIDAKEYWKDDKYLYLLRPMHNGKRFKTYVGNHPNRIAEARAKILRNTKRQQLIILQNKIVSEIVQIEKSISTCLDNCSRFSLVVE
jgi:hypothetical protein